MLILYNSLKPEDTLEVDKAFVNIQSVDDNNLDENFAQIIFASDEKYSNMKEIKDFFDKFQNPNEIGVYHLIHHSDPSNPILSMSNLKVRGMGINLSEENGTNPSIIVDFITRYANTKK